MLFPICVPEAWTKCAPAFCGWLHSHCSSTRHFQETLSLRIFSLIIYIYIFNILYIFCIHESVFFNCAKAECGCAWYEQHFAQCCKRIRRALAARKPLAINRETTKIVQEQDLGQNWGNLWDTEHLERIRLLRCYPKFVIVKEAACRYETDGHESWDWRYRIAKAH